MICRRPQKSQIKNIKKIILFITNIELEIMELIAYNRDGQNDEEQIEDHDINQDIKESKIPSRAFSFFNFIL